MRRAASNRRRHCARCTAAVAAASRAVAECRVAAAVSAAAAAPPIAAATLQPPQQPQQPLLRRRPPQQSQQPTLRRQSPQQSSQQQPPPQNEAPPPPLPLSPPQQPETLASAAIASEIDEAPERLPLHMGHTNAEAHFAPMDVPSAGPAITTAAVIRGQGRESRADRRAGPGNQWHPYTWESQTSVKETQTDEDSVPSDYTQRCLHRRRHTKAATRRSGPRLHCGSPTVGGP